MLDHQLRGGIQPTEKGWKKIAGVMKALLVLGMHNRTQTHDV
jgi:hypothetical protein